MTYEHDLTHFLLLLGYPFFIVISPAFIYLGIDRETVEIMTVLMVLDTLSGGLKSHILNRIYPKKYSEFSTRKLLWGFCLKLIVCIVPITVVLIGKGVQYDLAVIIDGFFKIMIVSEGYSVIGNIYAVRTKKDVKKFDAVSAFLHSIRQLLFTGMQNIIKKIEKSGDCNYKND